MPDDSNVIEWPPAGAPWRAYEKLQGRDDEHPGAAEVYGRDGDMVALVYDNLTYERTAKERAALVAAAPELLDCLRGAYFIMEKHLPSGREEPDHIRSLMHNSADAIRKAGSDLLDKDSDLHAERRTLDT